MQLLKLVLLCIFAIFNSHILPTMTSLRVQTIYKYQITSISCNFKLKSQGFFFFVCKFTLNFTLLVMQFELIQLRINPWKIFTRSICKSNHNILLLPGQPKGQNHPHYAQLDTNKFCKLSLM